MRRLLKLRRILNDKFYSLNGYSYDKVSNRLLWKIIITDELESLQRHIHKLLKDERIQLHDYNAK